jgi:hypothetical protein
MSDWKSENRLPILINGQSAEFVGVKFADGHTELPLFVTDTKSATAECDLATEFWPVDAQTHESIKLLLTLERLSIFGLQDNRTYRNSQCRRPKICDMRGHRSGFFISSENRKNIQSQEENGKP